MLFRSETGAEVVRHADVLGCSVGTPKSKKSTATSALRLDLAGKDSEGASKYVVTVGSEEEKGRWLESLGAYSELTEVECGLFSTRLHRVLNSQRPEPEPEPQEVSQKAFKLLVSANVLVPSARKISVSAGSIAELEEAVGTAIGLPAVNGGVPFVLCFWDEEFEEYAAVADFGSLPEVAKVELDPKPGGGAPPAAATSPAPQPQPEPESDNPRARRPRREKARRGSVLRGVLELKIVLVGGAACGKSCLLSRLIHDTCAETHVPVSERSIDL